MDVIRHDSMLPASDIPEAIQWHEGMLLAPQHFQQLAWRQEALLHYATLAASPFYWGVRHVRIDPVLLVNGLLRVIELEAIMPDGLLVTHTPQAPDALEVDLAPYAEAIRQQALPVHLAVPARTRGLPSAQGDVARYVSVEGAAMVDENTGEGDIRIPRLRPRLSLLLTATPPARYVHLPLACVCYQDEVFALTDFLPPTWSVPLHSPLGDMCTRIARRLREKAVTLAEKVRAPSATLGTPMLLEAQNTVHHLVAALPPLEAIVYSGVAHPYVVYLALCTVAGQVAALGNNLLPPVFEPYNHHDLRASFAPLEAFIMRMLDEGIPEVYAAFPFVWTDGLFRLPFDGSWMERRLVLAVRAQVGMSELDVIAWMEECLIGASTVIPSLVDRRIRGAERQVLQRDDDLIPARGVVLFTLTVDAAFIVAHETLDIVNTSERWGTLRPAEIVLYVKHVT